MTESENQTKLAYMASACLVGIACRYNGKHSGNKKIVTLFKQGELMPFCPELMGGLSTPREPASFVSCTGNEVLKGDGKVKSSSGKDVTEAFVFGAEKTLLLAEALNPEKIFLKAKSPSCSVSAEGITGVTAALLIKHNFAVEEVG